MTLSHSSAGLLVNDVVDGLPCKSSDANQYGSSSVHDSGNDLGIGDVDLLVVHSDFPFCLEIFIVKPIGLDTGGHECSEINCAMASVDGEYDDADNRGSKHCDDCLDVSGFQQVDDKFFLGHFHSDFSFLS